MAIGHGILQIGKTGSREHLDGTATRGILALICSLSSLEKTSLSTDHIIPDRFPVQTSAKIVTLRVFEKIISLRAVDAVRVALVFRYLACKTRMPAILRASI